MGILFGQNSFLKIGEEATYGTEQVSSSVDVKVISSTLQSVQQKERRTHLSVPSTGFLSGTFDSFLEAGGTIEFPVSYDGIGVLLKAALGAVTKTADGSNYQHVYAPADTLPSLSIQFQRGTNLANSREDFLGCKVSAMTISAEAGAEVVCSMDLIAKESETRAANITPSFPSVDQVYHYEAGSLTLNSPSGNLTQSSLDIRSFELSVDNKLDRRNLLGSKKTAEPVFTDVREVTMSVTCDVTDNDFYADHLAGNSGDANITFTRSADTNHTFKIALDGCTIEDYNDNITAFGRVERTFVLRGFASSSDNAVTITVVNANTSSEY